MPDNTTADAPVIAIVGAGLGGLTAALAFARQGARVTVLERTAELTQIGAGIQITPNAARALIDLGLSDALADNGIAADAVVPTDAMTGRTVTRFDLRGQNPKYRFFHRAGLLGALARAAQAAGVDIRFGVAVTGVSQAGQVQTTAGPVQADLVVGADGIHSTMRYFCDPAAEPATFTGQVAWRAIIPAANVPPEARIWMAPGRHVVTYPLPDNQLNIVAVQERSDWAEEGWNHADDPANLRAAFADCAPNLKHLLSQVNDCRIWGLFAHDVPSVWHRNPVVLLGDAAHPTLPFLAQGANLAIEDAYVLARCVTEHKSLQSACRRYQQLRRDRVVRAIAAARGNASKYHLSGVKRRIAFAGLKAMGAVAPNAFLNRLSWLYDHDVRD